MNAIVPKMPRVGERVSAVQMAQVMQAIRRFMPIAGVGVRVSYTQGGTIIHAKPSKTIGGGAPSKLIPWTCEWHEEEGSDSGSEESGSDSGSGYSNYGFFLPHKGTFQYNGVEVNFTEKQESSYTGSGAMTGSEWRCFSDIGFDGSGSGFVFCELTEGSGSAGGGGYIGNIVMEDALSSDSLLSFPVAWIWEETDSSGIVTRRIQQLEYGNEVSNGGDDRGCFRIKRSGSSGSETITLTHCYYEQENITHLMSDVTAGSSWANEFVWLMLDSSNYASVKHGDFSALQSDELADDRSVVPLYKFDAAMNVEVDFRTIPTIQEWMPYNSGGY